MTLKTGMILTALALSCLPQWAVAQDNLVVNGGFDTSAAGWTVTNSDLGGYSSKNGNPPGSFILDSLSPSLSIYPAISQTINSLTPGTIYLVSGEYRKGSGTDVSDYSFGVALDGVFLFEAVAPTNSNWYGFNFQYTAASSSALLSLSSQINGSDFSYVIDNISMEAVPEPNSLCLIGIGGIMSAMFFRSRRKSSL